MRLLNAHTKQFEEFFDSTQRPPYAILSHTWGSNELTFKDMEKNGYIPSRKIDGCCEQALRDGWKYVWVDTCCIDKSSSAELSEAINSMWAWYRWSRVCYAYLSDIPAGVSAEEYHASVLPEDPPFAESRWFTRGWTLQELIAPKIVEFYDESWNPIGRKSESEKDLAFTILLSRVTNINVQVLLNVEKTKSFSVAQKMSWAARRITTRVEDRAYSLLGLFNINMPLLYGEGSTAFVRLQEEILRSSDDETILAWDFCRLRYQQHASLFASSPLEFVFCERVISSTPEGLQPSHYTLTNKGLYIGTYICFLPIEGGTALARLNVSGDGRGAEGKSLAVVLLQSRQNEMIFTRDCANAPFLVPSDLFLEPATHLYIHRSKGHSPESFFFSGLITRDFHKDPFKYDEDRFQISEFYPPDWREMLLLHGSVYPQPMNLKSEHQDILFLIHYNGWPTFAVWFDYKFCKEERVNGEGPSLSPQELKCRLAIVEKGKTLAEMVLRKRGSKRPIEKSLDWQEILDVGNAYYSFEIDKEAYGGKYWKVNAKIKAKPENIQAGSGLAMIPEESIQG
jgi:hypothetical protein